MKTTQEILKLKQIKIDPELQALRPTNYFFVSRYRQAMRSGCVFPDIVVHSISKTTYAIISGIHRYLAMLQEFGEEYETRMSVAESPTKIERLEMFAKDNADHGNPLDGIQRRSIATALLKAGADEGHVANIFGISVARLEKWGENNVLVYDKSTKETVEKPVKDGFEPPNNTIGLNQWKKHRAMDHAGSLAVKANEIIRWLDAKHVKPNDENVEVLNRLMESIGKYMEWAKVGKAS